MKTPIVPTGARVRFRLAGRTVLGWVLHDRGAIGKDGRHLYLVRYEVGKGNWYATELPADEFQEIDFDSLNSRTGRELAYMIPVAAQEAHSLFAKPEHARSLAAFLRSHNVRFSEEPDAVEGESHFLIDRLTPWEDFVMLLNEWKGQYAEASKAPVSKANRD